VPQRNIDGYPNEKLPHEHISWGKVSARDNDGVTAPTGGSTRGPYNNGIRTRAAIIDAASRVFGQRGFVAGSLRQIAREVGISPAAIGRHFSSKEDLLDAVLRDSAGRAVQALGADDGLAFFDRSVDWVRHSMQNRGMIELLLTAAAEATHDDHPGRDLMRSRYDDVARAGAARLRSARERGDIRDFTDEELEFESRSFYATMDGLELQWLLDPSFDLIAAWEHFYRSTRVRWTAGITTQG